MDGRRYAASCSYHQPAEDLFDLVVSNPPYVLESEKMFMEKHVWIMNQACALFVNDENLFFFTMPY